MKVQVQGRDGFYVVRLFTFLLVGTWAAYGGYYMTFSCPWFTGSFTIPRVYRGMVDFRLFRLRKAIRFAFLSLKPTPVYADWRCVYHVDPYEEWGVRRFNSGLAAVKWAKAQDADYDSESSFSYHWATEEDFVQYQRAVKKEKETGYRQLSRDHQLEAFEDGGYW